MKNTSYLLMYKEHSFYKRWKMELKLTFVLHLNESNNIDKNVGWEETFNWKHLLFWSSSYCYVPKIVG